MATPPERTPPPEDRGERVRETARGFQRALRSAGPAAAASYGLIGGIVLFGGLGYYLDGRLGTDPWLLLGGLFLGIIVGFYEIARVVWRRRAP